MGTALVTPIVSTGRPPTVLQGGRIVQDRERDEATRTKEAGGQRSSVYIGQVRKEERQNMIYNDAAADSFSAATYLCKGEKRKRKKKKNNVECFRTSSSIIGPMGLPPLTHALSV